VTTKPSAEPVRLSAEAGFSAYAMESGFVEGWLVDAWVRGGQDQLGQVMALPSSLVSLLPGLDAVLAYLAETDPQFQVDPSVWETAAPSRRPARSRAASQQRGGIGTFHADQNPLDAFDVIVHLPYVTAANPHQAALARSSLDVQEAFARWTPP
jgi:hypothetical protein